MSARVTGLDLSLSSTGVASPDGVTYAVKPTSDGDVRLLDITSAVYEATIGADLVVIEDFVVRTPAAGLLGMVHGAVRQMLIERGRRYVLLSPATLKKFATGKGNASKTEMDRALIRHTGLELGTPDEVDAFWLRAAGLQMLGEPVVQLPAAQVAALDKVRNQIDLDGRS